MSCNGFICSSVGIDAAALVTTICAALAQSADTFSLLIAGLTAHLHYDIRGVPGKNDRRNFRGTLRQKEAKRRKSRKRRKGRKRKKS